MLFRSGAMRPGAAAGRQAPAVLRSRTAARCRGRTALVARVNIRFLHLRLLLVIPVQLRDNGKAFNLFITRRLYIPNLS